MISSTVQTINCITKLKYFFNVIWHLFWKVNINSIAKLIFMSGQRKLCYNRWPFYGKVWIMLIHNSKIKPHLLFSSQIVVSSENVLGTLKHAVQVSIWPSIHKVKSIKNFAATQTFLSNVSWKVHDILFCSRWEICQFLPVFACHKMIYEDIKTKSTISAKCQHV